MRSLALEVMIGVGPNEMSSFLEGKSFGKNILFYIWDNMHEMLVQSKGVYIIQQLLTDF